MNDTASSYQESTTTQTHHAQIIAIASGKGGVGKSNVAANVAICLASAGHQALLVDADLALGNLDILLGVPPRFNIGHAATGKRSFEEIVEVGPQGLDVVCGVSGMESLANLNELQRYRLMHELDRARERYETILVDTGAGIAKSVLCFCLQADQVLVVTTPEAPAMTDAYSMVKVLVRNAYQGQINVVVNMADNLSQGKQVYHRLSAVASRFLDTYLNCAGILLRDDYLRAAVCDRQSVVLAYPKAPVSAGLKTLAARLGRGSHRHSNKEPFLKKVKHWFS
ncbi:MinD/ParA family protein [Planctomycetota bacterium]